MKMKPTSQHDRPSSSQLSIPSPTRSLEERLAARPGLRRRVEAILDVAERDGASGCTADEAEAHAIEQVRALGLELMQGWAAEATEVATKRACWQACA